LENTLPRLTSTTPLMCLTLDHLLWPAMVYRGWGDAGTGVSDGTLGGDSRRGKKRKMNESAVIKTVGSVASASLLALVPPGVQPGPDLSTRMVGGFRPQIRPSGYGVTVRLAGAAG
jgi:hypothetical protein